ncbi:thioredoxin-dependent thiol peroxidase [Candidatus Woesearchaeota archaeon]|jgi:thioredoxin-dependent peroxiredoxin|nr:thioredoxin-dependent thiol peroxidase [Candidatus Woesearchaeota archaeon]
MLKLNSKAPAFSLKDKDAKIHSLNKMDSDYVVIFFYPKDNTPGCTLESIGFSNLLAKFKKLNATIVGISGGDAKSKLKFCEKHKLKLIMLSDPEFKISAKYGVYGEKSFMGKKYMGITRTTFILNKSKKIIQVYPKVKPFSHPEAVLEYMKSVS